MLIKDSKTSISALKNSRQKFESSQRHFVDLQISLIEQQSDLINMQNEIKFKNMSSMETMFECYRIGHHSKAKTIQKFMNLSNKMVEKTEFRAIVESQDWEGMIKFVKAKNKFNHKFAIDLLFSKGYLLRVAELVNSLEVNSLSRKDAKEYQELWLSSMRGKILVANEDK